MRLTLGPTKRDIDEAQAILDGTLAWRATVVRDDIARAIWRARCGGFESGLEAAAQWCESRKAVYSEHYGKQIRALAEQAGL